MLVQAEQKMSSEEKGDTICLTAKCHVYSTENMTEIFDELRDLIKDDCIGIDVKIRLKTIYRLLIEK